MRRLLAGAALAAACTGCGSGPGERVATAPSPAPVTTAVVTAVTPTAATPTATTTSPAAPARRRARQRTARRFVGAPDVRVSPNGEYVQVMARVDLPLPRGPYGVRGGFSMPGTFSDIPGISEVYGVRRCYVEDLYREGRRLRPGDPVTVRLHVPGRPARTLEARTRVAGVKSLNEARQRRVVRRLGCPSLPPEKACTVEAGAFEDASFGGGATCATARAVLAAANRWFRDACGETCATTQRFAGFRCTVAKIGEADWAITCRRGRQVVRSSVSY